MENAATKMLLTLLCLFSTLNCFTKEYNTAEYPFPISNPLLATIFSAANIPINFDYQILPIDVRPERGNIPIYGSKHKIKVGVAFQNHPAPLVFIVAGLGGTGLSQNALSIAEVLFQEGSHVVVLPNPFSWVFALGVSQTGIPGDLPQDAADMLALMRMILTNIRTQGVIINDYSLIGFSLGAITATAIAEMDLTSHEFNFRKIVLVNPVVDVEYGLQQLDKFYAAGEQISLARQDWIMGSLIDISEQYLQTGKLNTDRFYDSTGKFLLGPNDLQWIIGQDFRHTLRDTIVAGQAVHDLGVLKNPATTYHQNARLQEALQFSYEDYLQLILVKTAQHSKSEMIKRSSLYRFQEKILLQKNIYAMVNRDDFIMNQQDIAFLQEHFGDRLFLYPHGGHLGNILFSQNISDLKTIFAQVREN